MNIVHFPYKTDWTLLYWNAMFRQKDAGWCEASVEGGKLIIRAFRSYTDSERHTSVTVEYERRYSFVIQVKQMAGFSENDIPIKVVSATADTENNNNEMDKSYDDDLNTYFCSKGGTDVTKNFSNDLYIGKWAYALSNNIYSSHKRQ